MKLIADRSTVILAGSFNPSILSPTWVAVHGLGNPPGQEFAVEMLAAVSTGGASPRFKFNGVDYQPGFANLAFNVNPLEPQSGAVATRTAASILGQLPHTPVNGVGFNFAFSTDDPHDELRSLLSVHGALSDSFPGNAEVVVRRWGNSLKWEECVLNVDCELIGGQATISFNFHYSTGAASGAQQILSANDVYARHWERALAAARALSGEELEQV